MSPKSAPKNNAVSQRFNRNVKHMNYPAVKEFLETLFNKLPQQLNRLPNEQQNIQFFKKLVLGAQHSLALEPISCTLVLLSGTHRVSHWDPNLKDKGNGGNPKPKGRDLNVEVKTLAATYMYTYKYLETDTEVLVC